MNSSAEEEYCALLLLAEEEEEEEEEEAAIPKKTDAYWFDSTLKCGLCWVNLTQHSRISAIHSHGKRGNFLICMSLFIINTSK